MADRCRWTKLSEWRLPTLRVVWGMVAAREVMRGGSHVGAHSAATKRFPCRGAASPAPSGASLGRVASPLVAQRATPRESLRDERFPPLLAKAWRVVREGSERNVARATRRRTAVPGRRPETEALRVAIKIPLQTKLPAGGRRARSSRPTWVGAVPELASSRCCPTTRQAFRGRSRESGTGCG